MKKYFVSSFHLICMPIFLYSCEKEEVTPRPTILLPKPEHHDLKPAALVTKASILSPREYFRALPHLTFITYKIETTIPSLGVQRIKIEKLRAPTQLMLICDPVFIYSKSNTKESHIELIRGQDDEKPIRHITSHDVTEERKLIEMRFSDNSEIALRLPDDFKEQPYAIKKLPKYRGDNIVVKKIKEESKQINEELKQIKEELKQINQHYCKLFIKPINICS